MLLLPLLRVKALHLPPKQVLKVHTRPPRSTLFLNFQLNFFGLAGVLLLAPVYQSIQIKIHFLL